MPGTSSSVANTAGQISSALSNEATNASTTGTTTTAGTTGTSVTNSGLLGSSGYGGMYGNRYGMGGLGGMYGGMGGMYGGMGMGGMYGGMGMGGMYGQMGENAPFFQRAQMYIFQLCEIAQMVEFNANGLASFWNTLKNVSIAGIKFGKEWSVWLFTECINLFRRFKAYLLARF